jgi:hypothetical protein
MNTSDIGFFCFVFVPYLRAVLLDLAYSDNENIPLDFRE